MIAFAILFLFSLFLAIKHISDVRGPYYICVTITNFSAWVVLYTQPAIGNVLMCTGLGVAGLLIYFMMRTKPYETTE
ncbi:MAG: hypothetical protein KDD37_07390 [Bdellovibrionales bacterium]|nr:hypothetical protein [Bdellovibrionales bacterium]